MKSRPFTDFPRSEQGLVDNFIGTAYDVVKRVGDNIPEIQRLDGVIDDINTMAPTIAAASVETAMVPARTEIGGLIDTAEVKVTEAQTAANAAANSAVLSGTHALEANNVTEQFRTDFGGPNSSNMINWSRQPLVAAISNVSQFLSLQPVNIWEYAGSVVTKPDPANYTTWDWTPAFQAAVNSGNPIAVPQGTFKLFTPVRVKGGTIILGLTGQGAGYIKGTFLKPTTMAFISDDFNVQQVFFRLKDVGIIGGTIAMDLGLFHEVDITDVSIYNPSVGGIIIVRGEKHRLERIRMDARTPGIWGFSLGRWEESTAGIYSDDYFGVDGAFFDRASFKDIHLQGGAGGYFAYGIKSNVLSASSFNNFILHGDKQAGEISAIWVRFRTQLCTFNAIAPDRWGSPAAPCPALFDLAQVNGCTFTNVSPSFSGNNDMTIGFRLTSAFNTVFLGCLARGDNVTKYGWYIGSTAAQTFALISCRGAFFHSSASALVRRQVVQIGCEFADGNNAGSGNFNITDQDMITTLMADSNGANASTATWGLEFANAGGSLRRSVFARKEGLIINGSLVFQNVFGEASSPRILVASASNVTPEGIVTAPPATLYLFFNGTSTGKLYIKESGTGNTGWVLK